eukprot:TRINITY_DN71400_c0_g1_i1.p1 TRINITY_DN71400_c0_g1~~TRINITY_DN71400_c0_g1_i1.p1  ORF type:complete len:680 (-),score=82.54 TRINITY_DN71400_c0_g1_i1:56-2095(-)
MIKYSFGSYGLWFIFQVHGSVFPKAMLWALPDACACIGLNFLWEYLGWRPDIGGSIFTALWGSSTFVIGFLIVFRSQIAYSRYWEGSTLLQNVRGAWLNAVSNLLAFCSRKPEKSAEVHSFENLLARMMSMMHCAALRTVSECSEEFELLNMEGVEIRSIEYLAEADDKCEVILHWIQKLIVTNLDAGVIEIAPPIVSRVFQELSNGIIDVQGTKKIAEVPFPFPYAQSISILLIIHFLATPVMTSVLMTEPTAAFFTTLASSFCLWAVNYIAAEIENPFGDDPNDLPLKEYQDRFNTGLMGLVNPAFKEIPTLDVSRMKDLSDKSTSTNKMRATVSEGMCRSRTLPPDILHLGHRHTMQSQPSAVRTTVLAQAPPEVVLEVKENYARESGRFQLISEAALQVKEEERILEQSPPAALAPPAKQPEEPMIEPSPIRHSERKMDVGNAPPSQRSHSEHAAGSSQTYREHDAERALRRKARGQARSEDVRMERAKSPTGWIALPIWGRNTHPADVCMPDCPIMTRLPGSRGSSASRRRPSSASSIASQLEDYGREKLAHMFGGRKLKDSSKGQQYHGTSSGFEDDLANQLAMQPQDALRSVAKRHGGSREREREPGRGRSGECPSPPGTMPPFPRSMYRRDNAGEISSQASFATQDSRPMAPQGSRPMPPAPRSPPPGLGF